MTFSISDVAEHIEGLTVAQQRVWVRIANSALAHCDGDDAGAIKEANAIVASLDEHGGVVWLAEADMSHEDIRQSLHSAIRSVMPEHPGQYTYVVAVFDGSVVYEHETSSGVMCWRRSYTMNDAGEVTLGDPEKVVRRTVYEPVMEASHPPTGSPLLGDLVPLTEKSLRRDGSIPIKVIAPGWGSSGFYSPEVLERDGPGVFAANTHMYWDHPALSEDAERPERSLRDLAAVLVSDARWDAAGAAGPGLYADAQVFGPWRDVVEELAPHIGVSIRALGAVHQGEAEGKKGAIVDALTAAKSIDFVTAAGAGGKVLQLFEAARGRGATTTEVDDMELKEIQGQLVAERAKVASLEEAQRERDQELARLREGALLREAADMASAALAKQEMPDVTRARLVEMLRMNPPVKDGALDRDALTRRIDEAVKTEAEYLAKVMGSGRITGMGSQGGGAAADAKESAAALEAVFGEIIGDAALAKLAAAGRG